MAGKLSGVAIQSGTITTTQISSSLANSIEVGEDAGMRNRLINGSMMIDQRNSVH